MSIHGNALMDPVNRSQNDVGALAAYSRDGQHFGHCTGYFAFETRFYVSGRCQDIAGLGPVKTRGMDIFFELTGSCPDIGIQRGVFLKKQRRDFVDFLISALRGELDRDHELPRRAVMQGALWVRVKLLKD